MDETGLRIEAFWSLRSPYSRIAIPKLAGLAARWRAEIEMRAVRPILVRDRAYYQNADPTRLGYIWLDSRREAERQGLPFKFPEPDPVATLSPAVAAPEQPRIERLTRLAEAAARAGRGLAFAERVSALLWSPETGNWEAEGALAAAVAAAGLDLGALEAEIAADADALDARIAANEAALARRHQGVPVMVLHVPGRKGLPDGEPFFGQDRVEALDWRLAQLGAPRRSG